MGALDPCSCNREVCNRTWPRDPCVEVTCPTCGAEPGVLCKRGSGHVVWTQGKGLPRGIHGARHNAALAAGAYGSCPLGICKESGESVTVERQANLQDYQ